MKLRENHMYELPKFMHLFIQQNFLLFCFLKNLI